MDEALCKGEFERAFLENFKEGVVFHVLEEHAGVVVSVTNQLDGPREINAFKYVNFVP